MYSSEELASKTFSDHPFETSLRYQGSANIVIFNDSNTISSWLTVHWSIKQKILSASSWYSEKGKMLEEGLYMIKRKLLMKVNT